MAETIRDVVIRIRLEQTKSKLEVPGVKEAETKIRDVNIQVTKLDKKLEGAASAATRLGVEGVKAGVEVFDSLLVVTLILVCAWFHGCLNHAL
ncbi:MAG: hypothetical protein IH998_13980 [Proteobacteria bacterium]|nr:hypothetical protein [Pseudomonadota bacterium]